MPLAAQAAPPALAHRKTGVQILGQRVLGECRALLGIWRVNLLRPFRHAHAEGHQPAVCSPLGMYMIVGQCAGAERWLHPGWPTHRLRCVQELKGNIRVFCRVRPLTPTETSHEGEGAGLAPTLACRWVGAIDSDHQAPLMNGQQEGGKRCSLIQ